MSTDTASNATSDARGYNTADIHKILRASVELAIAPGEEYRHAQLPTLHTNITTYADKKLAQIRPANCKSIVTCTLVQNTGAGFHIANATHWDNALDSLTTYKHETDGLVAVVSAYMVRCQ
ncbi:hypothetical protein GGI15_003413 [Coemansia interrupta]|uniref:Uncharacterized protein n=1 Tax=Coemansia interrupta TaxID=1126814 RepID=A0A9W8H9Q9_9FUNG|nr:hypothetical protein GGI15_003413 [Coemansia interrupta]